MSNSRWTLVERLSWICGIAAFLLGVIGWLFNRVSEPDANSKSPVQASTQHHEVVSTPKNDADTATKGEIKPTLPDAAPPHQAEAPIPKFSRSADVLAVEKSFGDRIEGVSDSKHVAPDTPGNATIFRKRETLEIVEDQIVYGFQKEEQDAAEKWVTTAEPLHPQAGSRNPRKETVDSSCRAKLQHLKPPVYEFGTVHLTCAANDECWKCRGEVLYSFGTSARQELTVPHREIYIHPNSSDLAISAVNAIKRLQYPEESYKK